MSRFDSLEMFIRLEKRPSQEGEKYSCNQGQPYPSPPHMSFVVTVTSAHSNLRLIILAFNSYAEDTCRCRSFDYVRTAWARSRQRRYRGLLEWPGSAWCGTGPIQASHVLAILRSRRHVIC